MTFTPAADSSDSEIDDATGRKFMDLDLSLDFLRVVEQAAIACAQTMGQGDRHKSDQVAVEAMRRELDSVPIDGTIVIGEGERDEAPMLYIGEKVGQSHRENNGRRYPQVDIAVDPLEGTNLCATGAANALAVLAASRARRLTARAGYLHGEAGRRSQLEGRGRPRCACPVQSPRHCTGARSARRRSGRDSPRQAASQGPRRRDPCDRRTHQADRRWRFLSGDRRSRRRQRRARGDGHRRRARRRADGGRDAVSEWRNLCASRHQQTGRRAALPRDGITDPKRIYRSKDLASGERIIFAATGVTDGTLMQGVRFFGDGTRTTSLVMQTHQHQIRFIDSIQVNPTKDVKIRF